MACATNSINKEDLKKIYTFAFKGLEKEMTEGRPLTIEFIMAQMKVVYNKIFSKANNPVSAANYASTVPSVFANAITSYVNEAGDKALFKYATARGFDFNTLYSIAAKIDAVEGRARIALVEQMLGIDSGSKQDVEDAQQTATEVAEMMNKEIEATRAAGGAMPGAVFIEKGRMNTKGDVDFIPTAPTAFRSTIMENESKGSGRLDTGDPVKMFQGKVIRYLVNNTLQAAGIDSRNVVTKGASKGIHIRFISPQQAQDLGFDPFILPEGKGSPYYAVPIGEDGDILYFDRDTAEITTPEEGMPVILAVPQIEYDITKGGFYYIKDAAQVDRSIDSFARFYNISYEEAEMGVQAQLAVSYAVKKKLIADPAADVRGYVNGGSLGFILDDARIKTPISSIVFSEGPQSYRLKTDTLNELGRGKGLTYLYTKDVGEKSLLIWKPLLSAEVAETVATLFTMPITNTITHEQITVRQRRDLIDQFIYRGGPNLLAKLRINWDNLDAAEFRLRLGKEVIDLSTPEKREIAKQMVLEVLRDGIYLNTPGNLLNAGAYDPVKIHLKGDDLYYTPSFSNYKTFLENEGIYINSPTNDDKKLVILNPYVTFGMDTEMLEDLKDFLGDRNDQYANLELRDEYVGKFIYSTPGTGKSTIISLNENLLDADDLLLDYVRKIEGTSTFNTPYAEAQNSNIGLFLTSLFNTQPAVAEEIYDKVLTKIKDLVKEGKTVLTGSHRFIPDTDIVFIDSNPERLLSTLYIKAAGNVDNVTKAARNIYHSQERAKAEMPAKVVILSKQLYDMSGEPVLFKKPEPMQKSQEDPPPPEAPSSTTDYGGFNPADFKTAGQKEREVKATQEQIDAAEAWYNSDATKTLRQYLPFEIMFNAVNLGPTAVAAWSRAGIILTHRADMTDYYHEAFHAFINTFMTSAQRAALFDSVRAMQGSFIDYNGHPVPFKFATVKQLEEYLAEGFRNYMLDPSRHKLDNKTQKSIFEWLRNLLKVLFGYTTLDQLSQDTINSAGIINELYENLRVGTLTGYSFVAENAVFDRVATGMVAMNSDAPVNKMTFTDSDKIVKSMDALISEYIDLYPLIKSGKLGLDKVAEYNNIRDKRYANKPLTASEKIIWNRVNDLLRAKRKQPGGFTITLLQNKNQRISFYRYIKRRFEDKLAFFKRELAAAPGISVHSIQKKIELLEWTIDNFGDDQLLESNYAIDSQGNIKGVIGYHLLNTTQFEQADKEALLENIDISEDDIYLQAAEDYRGFGEESNTVSILERADADVIHILHSLYDPNSDTPDVPKLNDLYIPQLIPFDRVWNNMVRLLEGIHEREDMYKALMDEIVSFPAYAQLLSKIGTPYIDESVGFDLRSFTVWNKILRTFRNVHIPLIQTTITESFTTDEGLTGTKASYKITTGTASAVFKRVGERWEERFQEMNPGSNNYILRPNFDNNVIDLQRHYNDFKGRRITLHTPIELMIDYLHSIGIHLDKSPSILSAIRGNKRTDIKQAIIAIQNTLLAAHEYNLSQTADKIVISSIGSLIKLNKPEAGITGLNKAYELLQKLESRYSDMHSNFMVINAEENPQYEHSLNSTITLIINVLNDSAKYKTLQDILLIPRMKYLDPQTNVFSEVSTLMNTLFIIRDDKGNLLDPGDIRYGKRRTLETGPYIQIEVNNLSGIALISDSEWKSGIANANSDVASKLLSELHNFAQLQVLEVMRHSDKKFSFAVGTDHVYANGRMQKTYVDIEHFIPGGIGIKAAVNLIRMHLSAELKRINKFKNLNTDGLVYDFKYLKRGQRFILFEDMPQNLEQRLLELSDDKSLLEHMKEDSGLAGEVNSYIEAYISILSDNLSSRIAEAEFIDMPYALRNKGVTRRALIDAFVANNVIHNLETLVIIYGDPAMYAIEKEEFHKRNSGAGGAGILTPTDAVAINFINNKTLFNKDAYAMSRLGEEAANVPFDGTLNTAVIEDPVVQSAYVGELSKYMSEKDLDKYKSMKIADAQGYIAFDTYRMLRILQARWSNIQEQYYQAIIKGAPVETSKERMLEIFPPEKYQYWGQLKVAEGLMPVIGMHKFALIPLVPNVIGDNTLLTKLHDKMMKEGIGYALFGSGSKLGTLSSGPEMDNIFAKSEGKMDSSLSLADNFDTRPFTKNTIFVEYLKNQVEIAPNFKDQISFSSQMRKLVEDGYMENGVPTDYMKGADKNSRINAWNALDEVKKISESPRYAIVKQYEAHLEQLTVHKKRELIDKMGLTFNSNGTIKSGFENFVAFVKRELSRREIGNHTINMIGVDKEGRIKVPLDLSLQADEVDRILNNIISKALVKIKVKGEAFIQVSNTLFDDRSFSTEFTRNYTTPTSEDLKKYGTLDLPYYRLIDDKVYLAKCKIALTGQFRELIYLTDKAGDPIAVYDEIQDNGKMIRVINMDKSRQRLNDLLKDEDWLNMGDHRKMVTIAGPRIPVQGRNSMEAFEVYEFLSEAAGPIIITPAEIVAKSGSDFDKDTLYMMTPHIYKVNGKVKLYDSAVTTTLSFTEIKKELETLYKEKRDIYDTKFKELQKTLTPDEQRAYDIMYGAYKAERGALKSDLDSYDNLYSLVLKGEIVGEQAVAITNRWFELYTQLDILNAEHARNRKRYAGAFKSKRIDAINKQIEDYTAQLNSLQSGAIENDLITDYATMVGDPEGYASLVRPNSNDILEPIAKDLANRISKYKPTKWFFRTDKEGVAGTRIIELEYNLYKHESNSVGKQVLGIGAVDNTYNILFNRIGAYMKAYAAKDITEKELADILHKRTAGEKLTPDESQKLAKAKAYRQTIYMPHNKLIKHGQEVISLSDIYDADNEYVIGDIISQFINGWVDVAKDAWVFNIQGNREITPTLLFMIQAGVPVNTAIYFASQPLVREYVRQQRLAKSAFGKPLGIAPNEVNMFRNQARAIILSKYGFPEETGINKSNVDNLRRQKWEILKTADKYIPEFLKTMPDSQFNKEKLYEAINSPLTKIDNHQRAAFLHFIQMEEMTKAATQFKMSTNVDTARTNTLFSAIDKEVKMNTIKSDYRLPGAYLLKELKTSSPISSFFIQDWQMQIANQLFPIRNSRSMLAFIKKNLSKVDRDIEDTFGDDGTEEFWNAFRNNSVSFLFQNALRTFPTTDIKAYKGYEISREFPVERQVSLAQRVVVTVKDGKRVIYIDTDKIYEDFNSKYYTKTLVPTRGAVPYAPLDPLTFNELNINTRSHDSYYEMDDMSSRQAPIVQSKQSLVESTDSEYTAMRNQYVKFVIERELLRHLYPISRAKNQLDYKQVFSKITSTTPRRAEVAYEEFLRNRALDNIFNPFKMFIMDGVTMAQTFVHIRATFDELRHKYPIMNALVYDPQKKVDSRYSIKNIRLRNTKLTAYDINLYHDNLRELADPSVIKVPNKEDNRYISDFFAKLSFYGYLQSGLNYRGRYSLNKVLPNDTFIQFMTKVIDTYGEYLNKDSANLSFYDFYYPTFVKAEETGNTARISKRVKTYISMFNMGMLSKLDKRPEDFRINPMKYKGEFGLLLPLSVNPRHSVYKDSFGRYIFKPLLKNESNQVVKMNAFERRAYFQGIVNMVAESKKDGKQVMLVHNATVNPRLANVIEPFKDWVLTDSPMQNKVGIPLITYDSRSKEMIQIKDDKNSESKVIPNQEFKALIDKAIEQMIAMKDAVTFVWNLEGYGTHFRLSAPMTYGYLSEQLAKNFGYANPHSKTYSSVAKAMDAYYEQPMTYEEAAAIFQKCITG